MNTKENILIIDAMKYVDKKTGEIKSRVGFIFNSDKHLKSTDKFVGFNELSCFYDGDIVSKLSTELIMKPVIGIFEVKTNQSNPMKTNSILTAIEYKGNVYNLL